MIRRLVAISSLTVVAGCGGASATAPTPAPTGSAAIVDGLYVLEAPAPPHGAAIVHLLVPLDFGNGVAVASQISGAATGLVSPTMLRRSPRGDLYAVEGTTPRISIFTATANGNVAPKATLAGAQTELTTTASIAFDASGALYAAVYDPGTGANGKILRFAPGATGDAAPVSIITGPATTLNEPTAIAVDGGGNVYVATPPTATNNSYSLAVFPPGASGNVAPATAFATNALPADVTGLIPIIGTPPRLAAFGESLYAVQPTYGGIDAPIFEYGIDVGPGDAIDPVTLRDLNSGGTVATAEYADVAVDSAGNVIVANFPNNTIDYFSATANGMAQPISQITGPYGQTLAAPNSVTL